MAKWLVIAVEIAETTLDKDDSSLSQIAMPFPIKDRLVELSDMKDRPFGLA